MDIQDRMKSSIEQLDNLLKKYFNIQATPLSLETYVFNAYNKDPFEPLNLINLQAFDSSYKYPTFIVYKTSILYNPLTGLYYTMEMKKNISIHHLLVHEN